MRSSFVGSHPVDKLVAVKSPLRNGGPLGWPGERVQARKLASFSLLDILPIYRFNMSIV
jgi:hypothetical protein